MIKGLFVILFMPVLSSLLSALIHEQVATFPEFTIFQCWLLMAFVFTISFVPLVLIMLSVQIARERQPTP